jgi:hypothetical protein
MSTRAATLAGPGPAPGRWLALRRPELCFWIVGLLVYGGAAVNFAAGHFLDQISRDLWQHLAALKALIADPFDPANPFVVGDGGSRHFHPYWVGTALFARLLGWNEWQAIAAAGFVSAGVLLAGIWTFARRFYDHRWGPFALLAATLLGWSLPISHTGYHSLETLIEGIAYPATLLVGLSLLLCALVIDGLERPRRLWAVAPLAGFMFATHQLGAGIAFVAAGWFVLLWPTGTIAARGWAIGAMLGGLLLAAAWPYHNPWEAILRTGNATWTGGLPFYSPFLLAVAFIPSLIGLWGLCEPGRFRRSLPVLAAVVTYAGIFAIGAFGWPIATRFVMPAVLMLHVGLGALLLRLGDSWRSIPKRWQVAIFALAAICVELHGAATYANLRAEALVYRRVGSAYDAARTLTADIRDDEPVAAYDSAAWPIVATGQRVMSVPWPEPMIADLADRQRTAERLFDPRLTAQQRRALAASRGVRTLILDRRGPIRRRMPAGLVEQLERQSARRRDAGPFIRFDLD